MKGYKKNELEMFLLCSKKALQKLIDENPKSGLIVEKDTSGETKMKYKDALVCLQRLEDTFAIKGAFSFGICGNCTKFNTTGHANKNYGTCNGRTVGYFDTCDNHSKEGGGWGL
jgi:hypothetical protein